MRALLTAAVALGVGLLSAGAARAGLYNAAERSESPGLYPLPQTFKEFQLALGELRSIAVERAVPPNPVREHVLKQVAALEAKQRTGKLTVDERVNLGAYYVRLQRPEEAVRVLEGALTQEPKNFMVLANLATADYLAGQGDFARLSRAIEYQQQALKAWPTAHPGFTADQLVAYRRFERTYLTLLRERQQEARLQGRRPDETLDDLFHVRYVGPGGRYEAGTMDPEQMDRLPAERVPLVSQLVLWLPFDNRLYWQLAELLNAQGDVQGADAIMHDLAFSRSYSPPELRAHRRVVGEAAQHAPPPTAEVPPEQASAPGGQPPPPATPPATPSWMPQWQPFLVGLVTGVVVTLLIGQQVRQTRARKKMKVG